MTLYKFRSLYFTLFMLASLLGGVNASAQINWGRALKSVAKAAQAVTLTDAQMAAYAKQSIDYMDANNKVSAPGSAYAQRLNRLTSGLKDADGIPLNFKVYEVKEVNAFACPDGSVRVFSSLMDLMDDDELLGIIGHEVGHVALRHSKNAFRHTLMSEALKDAAASVSSRVAALTDSQLGVLGSSLMDARYSQKQEKEADDAGYEFLRDSNHNPWGMVMSFEKLLSMEKSGGSQANYFQKMFSSHPDTKDRIKRMTDRCRRDGYQRPSK